MVSASGCERIFWKGKQSFERSHRWSVESVWEHDKRTVPISKTTGTSEKVLFEAFESHVALKRQTMPPQKMAVSLSKAKVLPSKMD